MKKHLLTYLSVSVLLLGTVAPSVSALAATPVSAAEQTSTTALDPNNLADGTYTIDAPVMKTGTDTASMAQTFIDKSAKLSVKNHQLQLTLHIKQGAGMIADVKTSSNNQPVTVSSDTGAAKDLTFNIASLTAVTNLSLTLKVGTGRPEKMDVQPAPATLKVVQLDQPAVSSSSAASSSNTADESSQVVQPGAASSSSATTSQPIIESSSTQSVAAASSSASKADSAVTQPAAAESSSSSVDSSSENEATDSSKNSSSSSVVSASSSSTTESKDSSKVTSSSAKDSNSAESSSNKPSTTTNDNQTADSSATFDPAHLVNGTYEVPITLLEENSNDASVSASFFAPTATVKVTGKVVTVTLHLIKNAATVTAFSLDGQAATITNNDGTKADLTFTVNDSFDTTIIPAAMTISVPVMHLVKNPKARVKFGQALFAANSTDTESNTSSESAAKAASESKAKAESAAKAASESKAKAESAAKAASESKTKAASESTANQGLNLASLKDGTYNLTVPIKNADLTATSAAQRFISKSVQLIVSDNGKTLKTVFFVTNGLQYIKGMTLNGKSAQVIKHSATAADYIFEVTPEILAGLGNVHFSLTTPIGDMEEDAFAVFNLSNQSSNDLRNKIQQKLPDSAPVATGTNLINPTKTVQYIPYKVLDETRSKLSTANNYYTHTAKVVKDSSGYKVYLTVQAPTGYVKFQPLSVNYGGYSDFSHSTAGGNDIWTYAFHISNEQGLDQPIPATISMTVPIAGISNQQFEVWLSFGKAQGGGTNYLAAANAATTQGLPATTISLVQAANGNTILPAAGTSLTAISATQPTKAVKAVKATKPAKTAANKTKKVAAATTITAAEQQKSAKLKDYPFMAEIAGFGAVALVIIGFAVYKRLHVGE